MLFPIGGVVRDLGLLSVPPPPCGVVWFSFRVALGVEIVVIIIIVIVIHIGILIIILIIIIIVMMFLSWVNCHRKRARQERLLVAVAFSIPLMAGSWLESVHCHKDRVCLEPPWEKYAQSQGFGIFGPGGGGWANRESGS